MLTHIISLLRRRESMPQEEHTAYWRDEHPKKVSQLPYLLHYSQDHTIDRVGPVGGGDFPICGFAEVWSSPRDVIRRYFDKSVNEALIADEAHFLSGLTGMSVAGESPVRTPTSKIWVYAPQDASAVGQLTNSVADLVGEATVEVFVRDPQIPVLSRSVMGTIEPEPQAIGALFFETPEAARAAFSVLRGDEEWQRGLPAGAQIVLTDEFRMFDRELPAD